LLQLLLDGGITGSVNSAPAYLRSEWTALVTAITTAAAAASPVVSSPAQWYSKLL